MTDYIEITTDAGTFDAIAAGRKARAVKSLEEAQSIKGNLESLAFKVFDTVRLTQVERQAADSNILTLSGLLRTAMANNKPFFSPAIQGNGVEVIKSADFLKEVVKAFDKDTDLDEQRARARAAAGI